MAQSIAKDYEELSGLREGAHYSRMDLHTHSPASECSSFRLPDVLAREIPQIKSSMSGEDRRAAMTLLYELTESKPVFDQCAEAAATEALWWMPPAQAADKGALAEVAQVWLADIERLEDPGSKAAIPFLKSAFQDITNVLMAAFFPPEYTLRCYIEQLEVVALTDHNHPGYIVPRLPKLGTWFDAVTKINQVFIKDIQAEQAPGSRVRAMIHDRLAKAKQRLQSSGSTQSLGNAETKKNHKDRRRLKDIKQRLAHIDERIAAWSNSGDPIRPLTVLPGTEITVSNIHCLTIFPPQWMVPGRIAGILLDIGIEEKIWGKGFEAAANASLQRTIDLVAEAGGIAIPAHSNSDFKGILRLFRKGLALRKVLEHPALLALEKIDGVVLAGEGGKRGRDACETLRWLDSGAQAPQRSKLLMFIKGSDAHECRMEVDGTGEDLGVRFTWIKMDIRPRDTPDEVFRALRLALLGGQGRVVEIPVEDTYNYGAQGAKKRKEYVVPKKSRQALLDWPEHHPAILGLMVSGKGSYAGGLGIRFNPFMNCVVGAEGKSTVLRLVAYAFGALKFLKESKTSWLPQCVRVFVQDASGVWCVERQGRHHDPNDPSISTAVYRPSGNGAWDLDLQGDQARDKLKNAIEVWPSPGTLSARSGTRQFDDSELERLVSLLDISKVRKPKPLLVHQPREIFHSSDLFRQVLRRPMLKFRQIIWASVSPNVPTALDAEKIIVTGGKGKAERRRIEVICGGDLHEDEVIHDFLDQMEGGYAGFARRKILYEA
jgi:hypothetical protein